MKRYVCSQCGYSREDLENVVEHVADSHAERAVVMEYDAEDESRITLSDAWMAMKSHVSDIKRRLFG